MIIDPYTGRTFDHDSALNCLEEWTSRQGIILAMVKSGLADVPGLMNLAAGVRLANENSPNGLTETESIDVLLQMIESKPVRKAITRHLATSNGITKWQAARELKALYVELASRLVVTEH